jgi:hypothetical protein
MGARVCELFDGYIKGLPSILRHSIALLLEFGALSHARLSQNHDVPMFEEVRPLVGLVTYASYAPSVAWI